MKQFNINKDSTLPHLEIEPILDGRHSFGKLYYAVQAATVTFSMTNIETNVKKIANSPAQIVFFDDGGCENKFKIRYVWNKRDVNESGRFKAQFKIKFDGNITKEGMDFPTGELIVPIQEEIIVCIN